MEVYVSKRANKTAQRVEILSKCKALADRKGEFYLVDALRHVLDTYDVPQYDFVKWSEDLQGNGFIAHAPVKGHFVLTGTGEALLVLAR